MMKWTDSAKEEFDSLFERVRLSVLSSGADPGEVEEDLKRHIEEELARVGVLIASKDDVMQIFAQIYPSALLTHEMRIQSEKSEKRGIVSTRKRSKGNRYYAFVIVFGIVMPMITLFVEAYSGFCASVFFDPIPTIWHIFLVALVPMANFQLLWFLRSKHPENLLYIGTVCGISFGISLYYTLIFLPLTPLAMLTILVWGMGLLPLTPLFSLVAILRIRTKIKGIAAEKNLRRIPCFIPGMILPILIFSFIELPDNITKYGLRLAASQSSDTQMRGIKYLRKFGNERVMLKSCYIRPGRITDLVGFIMLIDNPITTARAREIYYRVTGLPFNSVPPPKLTGRGQFYPDRDFIFDAEQGESTVGSRVRGLWLKHSRLDGSIDADAALAYLEWTMEFSNESNFQQEARAKIKLPPGSVVSRLTLWINGEERDAAFAARGKVTEAYTRVVRSKRDPVLVTTAGPDRILVQCFPVPPGGKTMKIRIGITASLTIADLENGVLQMPYIIEKNFSISDETGHLVWVESQSELQTNVQEMVIERSSEKLFAIRGKLQDNQLSHAFSINARRNADISDVWAFDTTREEKSIIHQTIHQSKIISPNHLVVIIDGSKQISGFIGIISKALGKLPDTIGMTVLVASDEIYEFRNEQRSSLESTLKKIVFEGGCDNAPALSRARDIASNSPNSALLWIYTIQPYLTSDFEALRQKLERRPTETVLYEIQCGRGLNTIVEKLDGLIEIRSLQPMVASPDSMINLFKSWHDSATTLTLSRVLSHDASHKPGSNGKETSFHLVRLWAYDVIHQLIATGRPDAKKQAVQLSMQYSLVTPVSGAVVLENTSQYEQSQLKPVTEEHIPTIPEPGIWLLLLIIIPLLAFLFHRERVRCKIHA